jgi:hypothetical protein
MGISLEEKFLCNGSGWPFFRNQTNTQQQTNGNDTLTTEEFGILVIVENDK